ncbi:unnamed protein product [Closterium sp. NIES-54]
MVVQEHELYGFQCRGLFASSLIAKGEIVCDWDIEEEERRVYYHAHDLLAVPDKEKREIMIRYSYMVEDDVYDTTTDPDEDPSLYYNHSCDPNSWYINPRCMVALRDIQPGEQITYDYASTETEGSMHAGLLCRCGATCCRGTLKFSEWRSRDWQQRNAGHCSAYIERKMAESGWYDPRVVPRYKGDADGSKGLFALASIGRGERVLVFASKVAGDERTRQLSLQINDSESRQPHPSVTTSAVSAARRPASAARRRVGLPHSQRQWRMPELQQRLSFPPKRLIVRELVEQVTRADAID